MPGCQKWELPGRKTQRDCGKPEGSLDAQVQQRKVDFSIAGSAGTIDKVTWDFGNGSTTVTTGLTVTYTYPAAGTFSVKATLSNTCGNETILSRTVTVADAAIPTVSLLDPSDITINSAILGMSVTSNGNATITSYGICYSSTNTLPEKGDGRTVTLEKDGAINLNTLVTFNPTALQPNTLYYVRSFAVNQKGIGYSNSPVKTFRTGARPSVSNMGVTSSPTTATVNFVVTNPGSPAAIEYGICYSSTNTTPELGNSPSVKVASPPVGTNATGQLTELAPDTRYYYRAYAKLPSGEVVYSPSVDSFTTQVDTLAQDLIASVSFTDGSKQDASGNNNHVIFVNNPTFVADRKGKVNSAVHLNGLQDYFYMAENSSLRPTSLTVSIWIKPITVSRPMQIFNKARFSDGKSEMYSSLIQPGAGGSGIVINTDIKQNSNCQGGIGWQTFSLSSNIQLNTWHHVVMTYSGRSARMYFDNALLSITDNLPQNNIDECAGGELKFGAQSALFPNFFYGAIDDIRIYRRALTKNEVEALFNQ